MQIGKKTFQPNPNNILSQAVDKFLRRQVYLDGVVYVTPHMRNTKVNLESGIMLRGNDDILVESESIFQVDPSSVLSFFDSFESEQYLYLVAQSVENFETFLKRLLCHPQFISQLAGVKFRDNKERIKAIKSLSPKVARYLDEQKYKNLYTLFLLVENVRHRTIHSKMVIDNANKINPNSPEFKQFYGTKVEDGEIFVTLTEANAHQLLDKICELAYMLYTGLSEEFNLPMTEIPHYLPPVEVLKEIMQRAIGRQMEIK